MTALSEYYKYQTAHLYLTSRRRHGIIGKVAVIFGDLTNYKYYEVEAQIPPITFLL